uniref:Mediator of RNA polymerase II transcription subunit 4 n=1 Tax=Steinernema glaseri TaxID=37863 RepID=A0A1I7YRC1_9BILA
MEYYSNRRPLSESISDCIDDLEAIVKQMVRHITENEKATEDETLTTLTDLFEGNMSSLRGLILRVPAHVERETYNRTLEKSVEHRNSIIQDVEANLKLAETALINVVFQANKKLHAARLAEQNPQCSEELVRFASQISKSYAVASPEYWQTGDPLRPYPTEIDFAKSKLAAPRVQPTAPALALLRSSSANTMGQPQFQNAQNMVPQRPQWSSTSPGRGGYNNASPRGAGTVRGMTPMGQGMNQMTRAPSPQIASARRMPGGDRLASPSNLVKQRTAPLPINEIGNMSSDSSSSSSSGDEASPS